jgi:hypothetical protein
MGPRMNRQELEQWLGERESHALDLIEIAEVLHVVLDASRRSIAFVDASELRELRFAVAVLRDVFARDEDVCAWLRAPVSDLQGIAPADLLSAGDVSRFVEVAVAEWNRPRPNLMMRARAVAAGV